MKKFFNALLDAITLYLPIVCFIIVFVSYVIMIFYRYIFHAAIAELYELNMITYVWCATLGAVYATRKELHISFEILYDKFGEKGKLIMRIIGDAIVFALFAVILPASYKAILLQGKRNSSILGISFTIIYFPFIILIVATIFQYLAFLIRDIKMLAALRKGKDGDSTPASREEDER